MYFLKGDHFKPTSCLYFFLKKANFSPKGNVAGPNYPVFGGAQDITRQTCKNATYSKQQKETGMQMTALLD